MRVEIFSLCDAATDNQGKLNILGTFDTLSSANIPFTHPQFAIAIRLRFEDSECGTHEMNVSIQESNGKYVIPPFKGKIDVQTKKPGAQPVVNMIFNMNGVKFETYGHFKITAVLDGKEISILPLHTEKIVANGSEGRGVN